MLAVGDFSFKRRDLRPSCRDGGAHRVLIDRSGKTAAAALHKVCSGLGVSVIGRFAALGLLALASAVTAAEPIPVLPSGPWDLDYGETQCTATRDYGKADDPITLGIRPAPNGETYELFVIRRQPNPLYAEELEGSVDFGTGPIKAWILHYGPRDKKLALYQFRISAAEMQRSRSASGVKFHIAGRPEVSFQLEAMPGLLDGLRDCIANLQDFWNAGGQKNGRIATPAKGDVRAIFSGNDYPAEAIRRLQQGTARYLLLINEDGHVAACHVLEPSGVPILDAMGCAVIQERAKFQPALDATRKPVRSTYTTPPIVWRIAGG